MARHDFERHTGEVQLVLEGETLADLYAEAGRALAGLTADRLGEVEGAPEVVHVGGRDAEALLVAWIDELIYRSETTGRAFPDIEVLAVSETALKARIIGRRIVALRTAVKAATFHRVQVTQDPRGGFSARVVLDV